MEILVRATVLFFFVWGVTRALGKRELAEMTAFELVLLVTFGDLIQQGVTQEDMSITGAMLAVGTIAFWILIFSYVTFKLPQSRPVLEGLPVVVVRDGRFLDDVMKVERLSAEEVTEAAREQGIDDLNDVRLAVLEPDGKFSFITRDGPPPEPGGEEKHEL